MSTHKCLIISSILLAIATVSTIRSPVGINAKTQHDVTTQGRPMAGSVSTNEVVIDVVSRGYFTCALMSSGKVKCWGDNSFGQLGDGSRTSRVIPGDVLGISNAIAIAGGAFHVCALLSDHSMKCWGRSHAGQLGNGTLSDSLTPAYVTGLTIGVKQISVNGDTTCASMQSGAAKCWGMNNRGQVGDGTTTNRPTPVTVSGLDSNVVSVVAGYLHSCAIVAPSSSVVCWGANSSGEVGDGSYTDRPTPVAVVGLSGSIRDVSSGGVHTCSLSTSGNVQCWGSGYYGQLGNGLNSGSATPVNVSGLSTNVAQISAFSDHTCAVLNSGEMRCWGRNDSGQVGDGTVSNKNLPTPVSGLSSGVVRVLAGLVTSCAVMNTGGLKCWGGNAQGQVGDGTTTTRYTPVDVIGLCSAPIPNCPTSSSTIHPKVLVLSYNPWLATEGKTLFEYESPNDPMVTSEQLRRDFCEVSGGFVDLQIVGRIERNEFPLMTNGQRMTESEYLQLRAQGRTYSQMYPGAIIDYRSAIEADSLNLRVKNHDVDEIWMFLSWQMSGFESCMGGPGAFYINGSPFEIDSGRAFAVMGFENAVGVPNSLESIGHRVESTLDRAYGDVHTQQDTPWARFRRHRRSDWLPNAPLAVGDIHNPPNSRGDYDWGNQDYVYSTAEDWLNFPNLTGSTQLVNCQNWECTGYGHHKWWYRHLPKAQGTSPRADSAPHELRENNWWKYIFQFGRYPELVGSQNVECQPCYNSEMDMNKDGRIDIIDIQMVATLWGARQGN